MDENDLFTLVYEVKGQTGDAKISVRPSTLGDKMGLISLPTADYLITKITYSGNNGNITEQGYACVSSFSTGANGGTKIEIAVGKTETQKLIKTHPDAVSVAGKKTEQETSPDTSGSSDASDTSDQQTQDTADEQDQKTTTKIETKKKKTDTPDEKYTKPTDIAQTAAMSMLSLIPLVFILVIGLAVMFIMHKRGKL